MVLGRYFRVVFRSMGDAVGTNLCGFLGILGRRDTINGTAGYCGI